MSNIKISALGSASALDGTEEVPIVQSATTVKTTTQAIADLGGGGLGYLVYTALLNQSGTDAPVPTVLGTPNLSIEISNYTYVSPGRYRANFSAAIDVSKFQFWIGNTTQGGGDPYIFGINIADGNTYAEITTYVNGSGSNGLMYNVPIEIREWQ